MKNRIYFDLTSLAMTSAGSAVYVWELCHRLMRLARPLQVVPLTCPFTTVNKTGISRAFNAILRDTLWNNLLVGSPASNDDYFIFPNINVPRKFYDRKYAIVVMDLGAWHNPQYVTWRGKISIQAIPNIIKNANRIFAISDYTAEDIANTFSIPKNQIIVAPCGLSESYKTEPLKLTKINGIQISNKYFLHVGTLEPKKNVPFLIKVYQKFRDLEKNTEDPVKLVLTGGESWKSSDIGDAIVNSPYAKDIIILGNVNSQELPSLYKQATALVFPSIFEGFGLPVIESLSQGTPVLINSNSSLTQFRDFGATVFENFEVDLWATELESIVEQNKRIKPEDIKKVTSYFDWDRTAKIVAKTIEIHNL